MIVEIFGRRHAIAFQKVLSREAFSELPAGPGRFYVVVVTGRFIRLEICTNQLSFSASCQCVKLSACCEGTPEGEYKGAAMEKGNEFKCQCLHKLLFARFIKYSGRCCLFYNLLTIPNILMR